MRTRGRGQASAVPRLPRVFRIPESPSLRRALQLQALPTNWLSKEVCGFSFPSLSPSFPLSGQRQISQGRGPWRRRGLLSHRGFPSGLSEPVSSPVSRRKEERKTTDPSLPSACRGKGRSACASLVRTGKSKRPGRAGRSRSRAGQQQPIRPLWTPAAALCSGAKKAGQKGVVFAHLLV